MTDLPPLQLDPGLDPWDQQPRETIVRYNQFCIYCDDGRTRTLRKAAQKLSKNQRYIFDVAAAFKWRERAQAWDRHRDHLDEQVWIRGATPAPRRRPWWPPAVSLPQPRPRKPAPSGTVMTATL